MPNKIIIFGDSFADPEDISKVDINYWRIGYGDQMIDVNLSIQSVDDVYIFNHAFFVYPYTASLERKISLACVSVDLSINSIVLSTLTFLAKSGLLAQTVGSEIAAQKAMVSLPLNESKL